MNVSNSFSEHPNELKTAFCFLKQNSFKIKVNFLKNKLKNQQSPINKHKKMTRNIYQDSTTIGNFRHQWQKMFMIS